jgi:hypothetical protein
VTLEQLGNFSRLLLYPVLILGLFLVTSKSAHRLGLFAAPALWLASLEMTLILRLLAWTDLYNIVVNFVVTPLLALSALAAWLTVWNERKRV